MINTMESKTKANRWRNSLRFTLPVLLDPDGEASTRYAPEGIAPFLPREQVPIGPNMVIDKEGIIRFYSLLDSVNIDAESIALNACSEGLTAEA